METKKNEFLQFSWRVTSLHMLSYLIAGIFALVLLNYKELFKSDSLSMLMRPVDSPIVAIGPSLQIIQGFVMSIILFPFRTIFLSSKKGWIYLLLLIAGFSTFAPEIPGPSTFEGLIYTTIPLKYHLLGLPETMIYSILFSLLLSFWYSKPKKMWNILSVIAICLIFLISTLGFLASKGIIKA
jgi:hypothetical protein